MAKFTAAATSYQALYAVSAAVVEPRKTERSTVGCSRGDPHHCETMSSIGLAVPTDSKGELVRTNRVIDAWCLLVQHSQRARATCPLARLLVARL